MTTSFMEYFTLGGTDQATVGAAEVPLDTVRAKLVKVKAHAGNSGEVYVGAPGVVAGDGYELSGGEDSGWIPVGSLSSISLIASGAGQEVSIMWLK